MFCLTAVAKIIVALWSRSVSLILPTPEGVLMTNSAHFCRKCDQPCKFLKDFFFFYKPANFYRKSKQSCLFHMEFQLILPNVCTIPDTHFYFRVLLLFSVVKGRAA